MIYHTAQRFVAQPLNVPILVAPSVCLYRFGHGGGTFWTSQNCYRAVPGDDVSGNPNVQEWNWSVIHNLVNVQRNSPYQSMITATSDFHRAVQHISLTLLHTRPMSQFGNNKTLLFCEPEVSLAVVPGLRRIPASQRYIEYRNLHGNYHYVQRVTQQENDRLMATQQQRQAQGQLIQYPGSGRGAHSGLITNRD